MRDFNAIEGFFHYRPFYDILLETIPDGGRVVEVGTFKGKGAIYLALNSEGKNLEIYAVDTFSPFLEEGLLGNVGVYKECLRYMFDYGVENAVTLLVLTSVQAADFFEDASLDCAFLDTNHDEESIASDIAAWMPKVKPGGFLAGDDYTEATPDVALVVDAMFPDRKLIWPAWYTTL